jgi:hypothetical protein
MLTCLSFAHYNSWWFMCFGWRGYYLEICYIMVIWKPFASSHPYKQGNSFPLVKIVVHSLLMTKSSICTYLGGALSCLYWVLIASIFLKLFAYMLLELISESFLYLVYFVGSNFLNITSLCCHQLLKRGRLKHLGPHLCFGN